MSAPKINYDDLAPGRTTKMQRRIAVLESEVARLQRIIDSRPAINAGLPQTYIDWSQSIYQIEVNQAMNANN